MKDDNAHAGKKGSAVQVMEGGGWRGPRHDSDKLHVGVGCTTGDTRNGTTHRKNKCTAKDTSRLRWRKHRTALGPTFTAAGTKLCPLSLSSPD